jgi:hypothetical protein
LQNEEENFLLWSTVVIKPCFFELVGNYEIVLLQGLSMACSAHVQSLVLISIIPNMLYIFICAIDSPEILSLWGPT